MAVKKNFLVPGDQIQINNLEIPCHVGCTPAERAQSQTLLLSIYIDVPLQKPAQSDRLNNTLNYAAVMDTLRHHLSGKTFHLIESVAEKAAQTVLHFPGVSHVQVRVTKSTLPGVGSVSAAIHREK